MVLDIHRQLTLVKGKATQKREYRDRECLFTSVEWAIPGSGRGERGRGMECWGLGFLVATHTLKKIKRQQQ